MRPIMQILYKARRSLMRLLRWKTFGVKVMLFNEAGELLLVRNSYGRTDLFVLPGGGMHRHESPAAAAARELEEETGIAANDLRPFAIYVSDAEGTRDTIHLFTAVSAAVPEADGVEVEEARFIALDALPPTVSAATLRRIAEYRGEQPIAPRW